MFQPDIPQNLGSMMRLCACLDVPLDIIEPCGFIWNKKKIEQSALDYYQSVSLTKHISWDKFRENTQGSRIILMTTKASKPYTEFEFQKNDILLAGRESSGVPEYVHEAAGGRILIPMENNQRSLNIVNATAMITGEALRQTKWST